MRQGDMVGRLAGDEFVLICEDLDDPRDDFPAGPAYQRHAAASSGISRHTSSRDGQHWHRARSRQHSLGGRPARIGRHGNVWDQEQRRRRLAILLRGLAGTGPAAHRHHQWSSACDRAQRALSALPAHRCSPKWTDRRGRTSASLAFTRRRGVAGGIHSDC